MSNSGDQPTVSPLPYQNADVSELVGVWLQSLEQFLAAAESVPAAEWDNPSPCPGWSIADVVAHVLALESELHGAALPDHEPDWAALPHAQNPMSRYTETGVDFYRSKSRELILAEFREILEWRRADLASIPDDPDEIVTSIGGWQLPRAQMIRVRILDIWIHDLDIRTAAGIPGDLDTPAAWVTAGQFQRSFGYVWSRGVQAEVHATLQLDVTGPGVSFTRRAIVTTEGKGRIIPITSEPATVTLTMSWPQYAGLSAGRDGALAAAQNGGVMIDGDFDLAQKTLAALAVTP